MLAQSGQGITKCLLFRICRVATLSMLILKVPSKYVANIILRFYLFFFNFL